MYAGNTVLTILSAWYQNETLIEQGICTLFASGGEQSAGKEHGWRRTGGMTFMKSFGYKKLLKLVFLFALVIFTLVLIKPCMYFAMDSFHKIPFTVGNGSDRYEDLKLFYGYLQMLVFFISLLVVGVKGIIHCFRPVKPPRCVSRERADRYRNALLALIVLFLILLVWDQYIIHIIRTTVDDQEAPRLVGETSLRGRFGVGMVFAFDGIIFTLTRWKKLLKLQKSARHESEQGDMTHSEHNS